MMSAGQRKAIGWAAMLVLLAVGTGLRVLNAGATPLWEDEAESSINAQTILEHGIPTDRFLGQPIYENIMFRPWPGSEEYEFKDLSYSSRGVVAYHGWLPLYAIAGSMSFFGQTPDHVPDALRPQHPATPYNLFWRTFVPRVPAVLFAFAFMALMYSLGRSLGGPPAGWAALVYAALAKKNVYYGSQARYYSLTLALVAACGWALWGIIRRGRWRDYLTGSSMLVLLFHTHVTSCLGMCVVGAVTMPWHRHSERVWLKRGVSVLIVMAGTLPWVWWTGFLENTRGIPAAWRMPGFWTVVSEYLTQRPVELGLFFMGVTAAALAGWCGGRMPRRVVEAFGARRGVYLLLSVWAGVMFLTFAGCMPAASFFPARLSLLIAVPCMLLAAMIVSGASYLVSRRYAFVIAPAVVFLLLLGTGRLVKGPAPKGSPDLFEAIYTVMDYLQKADLPDDTRLYATPNGHLVLTYYTGLPIQSVSPIRKTFLDSYPGPVVILRKAKYVPPPDWRRVRALADSAGVSMTEDEARRWSERLASRVQREEVAGRVAEVRPAIVPVPDYLEPMLARVRRDTEKMRDMLGWHTASALMFRGFTIRTSPNWWQTYQYRFVDPASRSGKNVNYALRVRSAVAVALPRGRCIVYRCPPLEPGPSGTGAADGG
jgi:hypothetical protein